jgi:hypothetical protein
MPAVEEGPLDGPMVGVSDGPDEGVVVGN